MDVNIGFVKKGRGCKEGRVERFFLDDLRAIEERLEGDVKTEFVKKR